MKTSLIKRVIFALLIVTTPILNAATYPAGSEMTYEFFLALQQCIPGNYKEKNPLSASVGPMWLDQTIVGAEDGFCQVNMHTPDGRVMQCSFPLDGMSILSDQHFLQGILNNDPDNPSSDSVNAENTWTDLKTQSCGF